MNTPHNHRDRSSETFTTGRPIRLPNASKTGTDRPETLTTQGPIVQNLPNGRGTDRPNTTTPSRLTCTNTDRGTEGTVYPKSPLTRARTRTREARAISTFWVNRPYGPSQRKVSDERSLT